MSKVEKMVHAIQEEAKSKDISYDYLVEKILEPENAHILEAEWALILDSVWELTYKRALSDNVLTVEENHSLDMIRRLSLEIKTSGYKESLQRKLYNITKNIDNQHYNPKFAIQKPTPWNWDNDNKKD